MAIYEAQFGGQTYEVDVPDGQEPGAYMAKFAEGMGGQQQRDPVSGTKAPSVMGDLGHYAGKVGSEVAEGLTQAFAPKYSEPNKFDQLMAKTAFGAPSAAEFSQKYISTPASQVVGAARAIGAPITGLLAEPARVGVTRVGQTVGAPEAVTDVAANTASGVMGLLAPQGLANVIPNAFKSMARGIASAGKPIVQAEKTAARNQALNMGREAEFLDDFSNRTAASQRAAQDAESPLWGARMANEQARQQYAKAVAEREAALSSVGKAESQVAKLTPDGQVQSPLAEGVRATPQGANVYEKFNRIKNDVNIELPGVSSKLDQLSQRFGGAGVAESLKPRSISRATDELADATGGAGGPLMIGRRTFSEEDLARMNPNAVAQIRQGFSEMQTDPALRQLHSAVQSGGGKMSLADVQTNMQGLGQLTKSTDSRIRSAAKDLYWKFIDDLDKAGDPGKTLLAANATHRQNMAADDLAEVIASPRVTAIDELGNLVIKPQGLRNFLKQDTRKVELIRGSFQGGELAKVNETLDAVFKARRGVPDSPKAPKLFDEFLTKPIKQSAVKVDAPTRLPESITPQPNQGMKQSTRFASASVVAGAAHAMGLPIPHAFSTAYAATYIPQYWSKMIFKAASTDRGRTLLRGLFADSPPRIDDFRKMASVRQYLESEGLLATTARLGAAEPTQGTQPPS